MSTHATFISIFLHKYLYITSTQVKASEYLYHLCKLHVTPNLVFRKPMTPFIQNNNRHINNTAYVYFSFSRYFTINMHFTLRQ